MGIGVTSTNLGYSRSASDLRYAPLSHQHGNITNDGRIGTGSNLVVTTSTSGVLTTSSRSGIDSRTSFPNDDVTAATENSIAGTIVKRSVDNSVNLFAIELSGFGGIFGVGNNTQISLQAANSTIETQAANSPIQTLDPTSNIITRGSFVLNGGTNAITLSGTPTANRTITVPDASGTLVLNTDSRLTDSREWTAETVSQAEAEAGTATTRRAWTAERVRQAIVAWYNTLSLAFRNFVANPTSANLATLVSDETGSGPLVFGSSPTLTTPTIATINGSTTANGSITIQGTSNATRTTSNVDLQPSGGGVTVGGTTRSVSAVLQINSTTQGFLPPRMTELERNAISTPATGLLIYNTTTNRYNEYSGTAWQEILDSSNLGTNVGTFLATPTSANLLAAITDETGSGSLVFNVNPTITNFTESSVINGNSGTARTLSLTNGTKQSVTLTGNCTFTMPTPTAGKSFILYVYSGTGGFTATFTGVKWPGNIAPIITSTANRYDIITFDTNPEGTAWSGAISQNYFA